MTREEIPANPLDWLEGGLTIREAADKHDVPKSTLHNRIREYRKEHPEERLRSSREGYGHRGNSGAGRAPGFNLQYNPQAKGHGRSIWKRRIPSDPNTYAGPVRVRDDLGAQIDVIAPLTLRERTETIRQGKRLPRELERDDFERAEANRLTYWADYTAYEFWARPMPSDEIQPQMKNGSLGEGEGKTTNGGRGFISTPGTLGLAAWAAENLSRSEWDTTSNSEEVP